ncbi:uncharacterized protein LOC131840786 [Achroia grisella]|uniref:uncharacterized protein LOC131840786 n=1 Tax=Achroia grisella TaxID=688607 RepID=UPI0027D2370C|nr:uncharacterized protein LOC131840786 [Achroia grisella]
MKTKQTKEESDKSLDEELVVEPKTRARKKASDVTEEDKTKSTQDEPKTSKELKKPITKPKTLVKKRPLGIRKTLRSKKAIVAKNAVKTIIKQAVRRGRKPAIKIEPDNSQNKETVPLIPVSEIKKEPVDDTTPSSRSSSPKTAGRRQRLSSDMIMMKSVLADTPSTLVLGPRTSPYSMRSERSNSPLLSEGKNLRSGKPRKVKTNLLNEVVMKEQKKRRRLLSDSKTAEVLESSEDCKKLKRGRSCSRDGSEISKCSDITESDVSLNEQLNDTDSKELNKKLDKSKTDLDIDIENNVQISTPEKVPSLNVDSNIAESKPDPEPSSNINRKSKGKSMSLKRSTSLDSDNNNSNRLKIENSLDIEDKLLIKTDTFFEARSSILNSMSETFNSKEVTKNMRKARRGRKAAATTQPTPSLVAKTCTTNTVTSDSTEDKQETLETLSKEIDDLINNLDQNIDRDHEMANITENTDQLQTKTVSKFYSLSKPLGDNNSIATSDTPIKDKETSTSLTNESTPSKTDDSENIRLHYEEDSVDKTNSGSKNEIAYKCNVASIDKLMDRLKEFEEFDKRRQRQESESKSSDSKAMMVTSDVVLIPKSGAEIKPLKDIQSVRSPEKTIEKENVLSCFENNSAISIVKRDQARKSIDVDLPNSVTLIKRNSVSARKESTSSNHSKESDAKSIFDSLGKDVTLTEIRKSVDKSSPPTQIDLPQFATLLPNNPTQTLAGVVLDPNQVSLTPRVVTEPKISSDLKIIPKRKASLDVLSRKSSESANEVHEEVMATLEKIKSPSQQMKSPPHQIKSPLNPIKSPPHHIKSPVTSITPSPVAAKSEEMPLIETEALPPPPESDKIISNESSLTTELDIDNTKLINNTALVKSSDGEYIKSSGTSAKVKTEDDTIKPSTQPDGPSDTIDEMAIIEKCEEKSDTEKEKTEAVVDNKSVGSENKPSEAQGVAKRLKSPGRPSKSARNSIECLPGPSSVLHETPESQKRKENVLRTLGLLTHKAAKEAKIEKLKEKQRIYGSNLGGMMSNKGKTSKSTSGDYTGTLKTVIKLNRNTGDKKKYRSSLKMTFQKSKNRSGKTAPEGAETADDDGAYYTIEKREGGVGATTDGGHRKSHYSNRLNNHDTETVPEPVEAKETLNLVIPEKASSFSIHPGRLCQDQCFYCGGKFGLFDTPCHIAQMKSSERQKKVLDNEEKLTIDSCLCDACYRHVDRRANCPSYRKRPMVKQPTDVSMLPSPPSNPQNEKIPSPSLEEESEEDPPAPPLASGRPAICHTEGCTATADNFIRRKWLIKMRSSVNKVLKLECDYPGLHTIPLCSVHHRALAPLQACVLCRRRITKHHNVHFIHHGYTELNPWLQEAGIPVQFTERPLLCKTCRGYCTLLQRGGHSEPHARGYRRKLLQIYNIEVPPGSDNEFDESSMQEDCNSSISKQKKKQRTKSKQRKSTEPEKTGDSESSERTSPHNEESLDKDKIKEESNESQKLDQPIEEDIESLISSNKILVPGAIKQNTEPNAHSDGSESETVFDMETPLLPLDKQTELQYLLQRQNNPAQFLQKTPNLTQKQKNILKLQTMSGIQKPGQQHRINDKNAKRIHKLGNMVAYKEKMTQKSNDMEIYEFDKSRDAILKNITLNDECTIESIPNRKQADINTLKNKWQLSESFTQVKKNLSELSRKLGGEKETKKVTDGKYSNPVKRLETNPSISVRELFPGEEEMNLQCNIEFSNVKGVTPEGWEKCNSLIQYDVETKKLWNELQRPYGNQSSFLRHLILLEKYFRSGDLVLTHNASPHAANYSDSVQSRLRAYDNISNDAPRRSEPAISLLEYRKKPSINGKSLLKSNQHSDTDKDPKKFMPPPGIFPKPKAVKNSDKTKSKPLPPELIAINTPNAQGRKAIQNVLHNIQQLVKDVSASDPTEVAAAPLPGPKFDQAKFEPVKEKKQDAQNPKEKKEISKSDTPKRQKTTSKPWRPTLMPITPENMAKIAREPTQVAVDGRKLHSLVQVMSSGKRYHITLQDYNKMCIMRREKLQQLQDSESKTKRQSTEETSVVTEIQPSAILGNGGTVVQNITEEKSQDKPKDMPELSQLSTNAATILKNVGLKNITIAPIPPKTATVTSQTPPAPVVSSALLVTAAARPTPSGPGLAPRPLISTGGPAPRPLPTAPGSTTRATPPGAAARTTPPGVAEVPSNLPVLTTHMIMPKIPKSLTVIPQTVAVAASGPQATTDGTRP